MAILSRVSHKVVAGKNLILWKIGTYYRRKRGVPAQTPKEISLFKKVFEPYAGKKLRVFESDPAHCSVDGGTPGQMDIEAVENLIACFKAVN